MTNFRNIVVCHSKIQDVPDMVDLSYQKRRAYEKVQKQFWKCAGPEAEISQAKWFEELITRDDYIMLTAASGETLAGFIIGKLMPAPEVYNPGGLTFMIDDFCVKQESLWESVGRKLIDEIKKLAEAKGASQILVVSGAHDESKKLCLKSAGLSIASEWYVGGIL